jgi:hypothetical protein
LQIQNDLCFIGSADPRIQESEIERMKSAFGKRLGDLFRRRATLLQRKGVKSSAFESVQININECNTLAALKGKLNVVFQEAKDSTATIKSLVSENSELRAVIMFFFKIYIVSRD